jgi:DNA gyrase subunit A
MVVMEKGKIVRSRVDEVRRTGRNTMGVQFANPDKGDSIVAVARNADRRIEVVLEVGLEQDASADDDVPDAVAPDGGQTVIDSVPEGGESAGSVASDADSADNADDDDSDDDAGGSE